MSKYTFKLFISSTFSDMRTERALLHQHVLPQLKGVCQQLDCELIFVDLRWGINEYVQLDHQTMDICLTEVKNCKDTKLNPFIMILIGDRYGWEPPPAILTTEEFSLLHAWIPPQSVHWLTSLYRLDENADPAQYILRERTGKMEQYRIWGPVEAHLVTVLRGAAQHLELSPAQNSRYFCSATHQEILSALPLREEGGVDTQGALLCVRSTPESLQRDSSLKSLIEELEPCFLEEDRLIAYHAKGDEKQGYILDDAELWVHQVTQKIMREIRQEVKRQQTQQILVHQALSRPLDDDMTAQMIIERSRDFYGRVELRKQLKQLSQSTDLGSRKQRLLLVGEGGLGKSSLMATFCADLQNSADVIPVFVGVTPSVESERDLTLILIEHFERRAQRERQVLMSYEAERSYLHRLMMESSQARPIVLVIDALDQLKDLSDGHSSWVPKQLPPHLFIICSTRPAFERYTQGFERLELGPLSRGEGEHLLMTWLESLGRTLTEVQRVSALEDFEVSGSPLYLRLLVQKLKSWHSWTAPIRFPVDKKTLISSFFDDLNLKHSPRKDELVTPLFARIMGLLSVSYHGLTEYEILEWCLAEPSMYQAFIETSFHDLPHRVLPYSVWSRISADLRPFFKVNTEGVISFFHREFKEIAYQKYQRPALHRELYDHWRALLHQRPPFARALEELAHHAFASNEIEKITALFTDLTLIFAMGKTGVLEEILERHIITLKSYLETKEISERFAVWVPFLIAHKHHLTGALSLSADFLLAQLALTSGPRAIRHEVEAWEADHPFSHPHLLIKDQVDDQQDERASTAQGIECLMKYDLSSKRMSVHSSKTHFLSRNKQEDLLVDIETGRVELKVECAYWFGDQHIRYELDQAWHLWSLAKKERVLSHLTLLDQGECFTDDLVLVAYHDSGEVSLIYADERLSERRLALSQEHPIDYRKVKSAVAYPNEERRDLRLLALSSKSLYLLDLNEGRILRSLHDPLIPKGKVWRSLKTTEGVLVHIGKDTVLHLSDSWEERSVISFDPPSEEREWRQLKQLNERFALFIGRTYVTLFTLDDPTRHRYARVADHHNARIQICESDQAWVIVNVMGYVWLPKSASSLNDALVVEMREEITLSHLGPNGFTTDGLAQKDDRLVTTCGEKLLIIDLSTGRHVTYSYDGFYTLTEHWVLWLAPGKELHCVHLQHPDMSLEHRWPYQGAKAHNLISLSSDEVLLCSNKNTHLFDPVQGLRWSLKDSVSRALLFEEDRLRLWCSREILIVDRKSAQRLGEPLQYTSGHEAFYDDFSVVFTSSDKVIYAWNKRGDYLGEHTLSGGYWWEHKLTLISPSVYLVYDGSAELIRVHSTPIKTHQTHPLSLPRNVTRFNRMSVFIRHQHGYIENQWYVKSHSGVYELDAYTGELTLLDLGLKPNSSDQFLMKKLIAHNETREPSPRVIAQRELEREQESDDWSSPREASYQWGDVEVFLSEEGRCIERDQRGQRELFQLALDPKQRKEVAFIATPDHYIVYHQGVMYVWDVRAGLLRQAQGQLKAPPVSFLIQGQVLCLKAYEKVGSYSERRLEVWRISPHPQLLLNSDYSCITLVGQERVFLLYNEPSPHDPSKNRSFLAELSSQGELLQTQLEDYYDFMGGREGQCFIYQDAPDEVVIAIPSWKTAHFLKVNISKKLPPTLINAHPLSWRSSHLKGQFIHITHKHYLLYEREMTMQVFDDQSFSMFYEGSVREFALKHTALMRKYLALTKPYLVLEDRFCFADQKSLMLFEGDRLLTEHPLSENIQLEALFIDHVVYLDTSNNYQRLYIS